MRSICFDGTDDFIKIIPAMAIVGLLCIPCEAQLTGDQVAKHPTIAALVAETNAHRARMHYAAVAVDPQMCLFAQRHANQMVAWNHHSGGPYMEIVGAGPHSAKAAIQMWVSSPPHHGILLSGHRCGFGHQIRNGQWFWVGVFR